MMKALGCAVVSCCVEGCILIPCGWECESEKVVADRKDESGQTEKIIHKKMHLNLSVLTRQITERNHVKSPNKITSNHRTRLCHHRLPDTRTTSVSEK